MSQDEPQSPRDVLQTPPRKPQEQILERLCGLDWVHNIAIKIITMLRDVPMSKQLLLRFTEKALCSLKEMPIQDLPAYIYQTLLFASTKAAKVCIL